MMLQSVSQPRSPVSSPERQLPRVRPDPSRIAVFLNRNARRVNERLAQRMERIVGPDHFFYSRTLEEAEALAREIVQRGYGTVVCGGGDGTLVQAVNLITRYVDESNAWRRERFERYGEVQSLLEAPRFGLLRLGTGNGMGPVVGAGKPLQDLKRIVDFAPGRTHPMSVLEERNERFFFGGLGYDSVVLNDFNTLKHTKNRFLRPFVQGIGGYLAAALLRSAPRYLRAGTGGKLEGRILTQGKAYYMDPRRGDAAIELESGSTLFEGDATMISAGTSPYFGFGFRVFPFATTMPGMMHLRVTNLGPIGTVANLPAIWRGYYRNHRRVFDFLVEHVRIELERPFPFQHSGDAQGMRTELDFRVRPEPLRMLDYYAPPSVQH